MNTPSLLFSNPDVIWSGVIASGLALGGVVLTVWINSRNIRRQLQHDAIERDKERKSDMRRQVYIAAAEELANALHHLSLLPQANLSDPLQAAKMHGVFAAAARAQIVCEPETGLLIGELIGQYGRVMLRLLSAVAPLHMVQNDIEIRTHHYDQYTLESNRILAAMSALNESGDYDPEKMSVLQKAFKFNQDQSRKINDERNNLFEVRNALNAEYSKTLLHETRTLVEAQNNAIDAIRSELNLGSNQIESKLQAERHFKQMEVEIDALLVKVRNTIGA